MSQHPNILFAASGGGTMRRLSLILLLCLLPVHGWAATAFVKEQSGRVADAGHNSQTLSITGGITNTGDTVVGTVWWSTTTVDLSGVTVCGNAATVLGAEVSQGTNYSGQNFVYPNVTSGACSIVASFSGNTTTSVIAFEEASGVDTTTPVDNNQFGCLAQNNPGTGADAVSSPTITTTVTGDFIYGAEGNASGSTITAGTSGWTLQENTSTRAIEHLENQGAAGSTTATFTSSTGSAQYVNCIVALQPTGGGGGAAAPKGLLLGVYP